MTIKELKDEISKSENGSLKIKLDKFLKDKFDFKERISSKMEGEIKAFDKELSANGIKMTLSGKTKTSLLDFKDGNKFSQITFSLVGESEVQPVEKAVESGKAATINNKNIGTITVKGNSTKNLRTYQLTAVSQLNDALRKKSEDFNGLLVIPTGGGKTFIATYWMLKHKVNKDVKVLWLAHRHSLLDQAFETIFNTCTKDVLDTKDKVSYHIISGAHDNTSDIRKETDIIIAGKDSFQNVGLTRLIDNWATHQEEILIVVDEAHHAPAKTYRNIIDRIKACKDLKVNVLGLTATPIRTAKKEQGLIEKMFPDQHIDGGIDLKKLINTNVLAKPRFKECEEKFVFDGDLSNEQIKTIEAFDKLPKELAEKIVKNAPRNNAILKEYKKGEYGKTIIFAIDQDHATTLQGLFKGYLGEDKVATVISGVRAGGTNTNISREDNQWAIEEFRKPNSRLEVLINVNILTEGVDIPDVRSIFLTRPTTSTILMTQMIGRGLRISEGKAECKIVSFIVDFGSKIQWENPEKTYIDSTIDFLDSDPKARKEQIVRLISISKIEEFARLADGELDKDLAPYGFMERIPVGFYGFHLDGSRYDVMVFEHLQAAYQDFVSALPTIEAFKDIEEDNDSIIDCITDMIGEKYFAGKEDFGFNRIDIERIVRYYAESEQQPIFYDFEDRNEFDLDKKVKVFYDNGEDNARRIRDELWNDRWALIFGGGDKGKSKFGYYIYHLVERIDKGTDTTNDRPTIQYTQKIPEDCTMREMKVRFPKDYEKLYADLWAKPEYSHIPKNERFLYEIDHIVEMNNKGKSILENLQVLTKEEHRIKTQAKNAADRLG